MWTTDSKQNMETTTIVSPTGYGNQHSGVVQTLPIMLGKVLGNLGNTPKIMGKVLGDLGDAPKIMGKVLGELCNALKIMGKVLGKLGDAPR